MIVVDASVLIGHLAAGDAHHARATELLLELAGESFGASTLTLAEVLVGPVKAASLPAARRALRDLGVTSLPLGPDAAVELATLRAATGLRMPDCCVLLAAESCAGSLATFDERLAAAALERGLEVHR